MGKALVSVVRQATRARKPINAPAANVLMMCAVALFVGEHVLRVTALGRRLRQQEAAWR